MAIRTIQVNLSADITNFQQNISRAERSIGSLGSELNNNMRRISSSTQLMLAQLGNNASVMDTLRVRATGLNNSLSQQTSYVSRLQNELNSARNNFGATSTQVRNLELQLLRAATAEQTMRNELARLNQEMSVSARMGRLGQSMQGLQGAGMGMTAGITLPVTLAIKKGIDYNALIESNQASFETLLGDAQKASDLMDKIQKMAVFTPFETPDLVQQSKILLSYGIQLQNILPLMTRLGDVAGNDKEKFRALTYAFSQIYARGKLTGDNLRQLTEAGFSPLQEMAKKTGKTFRQLQKDMEDSKISVKDVADALVDATSKGGRFFENMKKQSQTFAGQMSTLRDNINITLGELTKPLFNLIKNTILPTLNQLTTAIAKFAKNHPVIIAITMAFLGLAAVIGPVLIGIALIGTGLTVLASGFSAIVSGIGKVIGFLRALSVASLLAAGKILLITAAVAALGISIYIVYDNWAILPSWFEAIWTQVKLTFQAAGAAINGAMLWLKSKFYAVMDAIATGAIEGTAKILDAFSAIPKIGDDFAAAAAKVRSFKNETVSGVKAEIRAAGEELGNIVGLMDTNSKRLDELNAKVYAGVKNSISSPINKIKEAFTGLGNDLGFPLDKAGLGDISGISDTIADIANGAGKQAKKLEDVLKDMVDKIRQQAKSFADAFNLFDNVSLEKVSGERLFVRLDAQVKAMSKWKDAISNLKARLGANSPLLQELISKGPSAAGQILGLQNLSDTKLAEYAGLYNQKSDLALGMAGASVTSQFMQEKKLENIILNITGNTIATDNIDLIANKIIDKLKAAGVM